MIKLISSKVACFLCKEDNEETLELYEYAIYIVLSAILHIITIVLLSLCFRMLIEGVVFYISFISIRKFAGGYHAKTPTKCYLFSVASSIIILYLIDITSKIEYKYIFLLIIVELVCVGLIAIISPLDTNNRPLNIKEKKIFGIVSCMIAIFVCILSISFIFFKFKSIGIAMFFGIVMNVVVLIIKKFKYIK